MRQKETSKRQVISANNSTEEQSVDSTLNLTGGTLRTVRVRERRKTKDHMGNFRDVMPSQGINGSNEQSVNYMQEQQVWWCMQLTLCTSCI